MTATAFSLENLAKRSGNYLDRMVDGDGLPYFNIFYTKPAQAAHDWPDYGDVQSRQYQAAIMLRRMTGQPAANEHMWRKNILALLGSDGLLWRPQTTWSQRVADIGDQCLTIYALATAHASEPDKQLESALRGMLRGLRARWSEAASRTGFLLQSLLAAWQALGQDGEAWSLAVELAAELRCNPDILPEDGVFRTWTHMHSELHTLLGLANYAHLADDTPLLESVNRCYRWLRSTGTSFGFLPEVVGRKGEIVSCETCALMDLVGTAVSLANAGQDDLWADIERVVRNQLAESQARDLSWLPVDNQQPDTDQFGYRELDQRLLGAWAGWSTPTHFWGAEETLNHHWGGPELRDKPRLLQNCCGGSGIHALYIAWANTASYANQTLTLNLHLDRALPEAEIRCQQPYRGCTSIILKVPATLRLRCPEFCAPDEVRLTCQDQPLAYRQQGIWLMTALLPAGMQIDMWYPLPVKSESVQIGNPGQRQYHYTVDWKGATVTSITPQGEMPNQAYSDFDDCMLPVYYGESGPGRLYQRQGYLAETAPQTEPLWIAGDPFKWW